MKTIGLCMIVKNEEDVLKRCLNSVKDAVDEIIIVDTGSTDSTKEIAYEFTDKVYDFSWCDDFSAARNYSFSKSDCDYLMWLDADDILLPSDLENLILLKKDLSADVVMMKYNVGFDENNNPTFSYYRERILKNHFGFSWGGAIHEAISPAGTIIYSDIAITHRKLKPGDQARNLKIFEKMISSGKTLSPREKFYFSRELYYHKRYDEAIRVLNEFLEQGCGFVENEIEACRTLYLCYHALGKENEGLFSLFRSFLYDAPRAEICCDIGNYFQTHDRLLQAIYWYERAMACKPNEKSGGFTLLDCYDFIPLIELCVCYDRLGNQKLSMEYNERAGKIKPQNKAYLYNKQYFEEKLKPSH